MKPKLIPAIIGKDGRTSAIERCLIQSPRLAGVPIRLSDWKGQSPQQAFETVLRRAREEKPDFVIVGPEDPLAHGIVDALQNELGIPCIGPTKSLARLESSKAFTRQLLARHGIPGNPEHKVFRDCEGLENYLNQLGQYVVKPDGLTGGKGVKLSDAHLYSTRQALEYCQELFQHGHAAVVIEEKLEGEEFSLQSFCDGTHVAHMPVVQDHKRAFEGDTGPNTGGMGSYSSEDHSLPFLTPRHVEQARAINATVARALFEETNQKYRGILYGGFMAVRDGIRLLEYNARFGDPETLNVLSILQTELIDVCEAMIEGALCQLPICFAPLATVCKYIVPNGYPDQPEKGAELDLSAVAQESAGLKIYKAAVEEKGGRCYMTGSRAIAFVGIATNIEEAERTAEQAAAAVRGPAFHRRDIGTRQLLQQRIDHMKALKCSGGSARSSLTIPSASPVALSSDFGDAGEEEEKK